jgi:hypothetical protein
MPLHNVKPSTRILIRNYFVGECVAHRSREPAKSDSMDLSPWLGTRQLLPAEIHSRNAVLIAPGNQRRSRQQDSVLRDLSARAAFGELAMFTIQPIAPSDFNSEGGGAGWLRHDLLCV